MNRPVVLCGFGKVGRHVLDCLRNDDMPVVVVDLKPPADISPSVRFVVGDCRQKSVLETAGVANARGVIICTSDDLVNLATALAVRSLTPSVRIIVRAFNPKLVPRLGQSMANVIALSVSALSAPLLAQVARTGSALGSVPAADGLRPVAEFAVTEHSGFTGKTLSSVASPTLPLAWLPASGKPRLLTELTGDEVLSPGDRVVVCGRPSDVAALTGDDHANDPDDVRWAGWLRRQWRAVVRTFTDVERPVRIAFSVLVALLSFSTLVYCLHGESVANAFYHTVSVMATGGDLNAEKQSPTFKTFVSVLKLAGAALLAAFTAILTNYLVRARLGGALEIRRIPDGGHVVVCGLGNIGFRVVEELLRAGQSVVVVEANRDNTFLATARQLGAAVVIGNCTVSEALKQAKVETARSVVCATDSDLVNVESALLVRELKPLQRVVVRLSDADMAQSLRDAANIRLAVSIPALAAPAFAAALYGDRLDALFLVGGKLLTSVELGVEAGDACLDGETVQSLIANFGLVPVCIKTHDGKSPPSLAAHRLALGDRLTAVLALTDLDRLYRRESRAAK
jgi:Trk K+ transport system NAD-binding subunit